MYKHRLNSNTGHGGQARSGERIPHMGICGSSPPRSRSAEANPRSKLMCSSTIYMFRRFYFFIQISLNRPIGDIRPKTIQVT